MIDQIRDWQGGERGAESIRAGHQTYAQSASIREPFHRYADAAAVHGARTNSADRINDVESGQGIDEAGADPANRHQDAGEGNHQPRSKAIDQVSVDWEECSLRNDEECQRPLHGVEARVKYFRQVGGEECPGVLQIGDGQHREDAWQQDWPSTRWLDWHRCRVWHDSAGGSSAADLSNAFQQLHAGINRFRVWQLDAELVAEFNNRTDNGFQFRRLTGFDVLQHRRLVLANLLGAFESLLDADANIYAKFLRDCIRFTHDSCGERSGLRAADDFDEGCASQCANRVVGDVAHELDPNVVTELRANRATQAGFNK